VRAASLKRQVHTLGMGVWHVHRLCCSNKTEFDCRALPHEALPVSKLKPRGKIVYGAGAIHPICFILKSNMRLDAGDICQPL